MVTVACVLRSGGGYTVEYVERLKAGVDAHLKGHEFVCLSDVSVPAKRIPLVTDWKGWWAKIELFRLKTPTLYLDLDTVVTGDITDIAHHEHEFTMLSDFYHPERPASGVMAWKGDYSHLFHDFDPSVNYPGHGDGGYIASKVEPDRLQDLFPGQAVSRKVPKSRNPDERLVCFHGRPRPHEVDWRV